MEPHAGSPQVWSCFQPTENTCKGPTINFFGCLYNANGLHMDLEKVDAVHALPAPMNVTELQEFLGMVTYLSPYHLWPVHSNHPSARTPEKRCQLHLECQLCCCFSVSQSSCHQQHHPQILWPVTACDHTSQCLTGRSRCSTPTEQQTHSFASKALTDAECRYANIEREMLAVVFRAERFCTYVYWWSFMIKSDQKPLESISRKNLADMPAWFQCMMLCPQGYDLTIHYCPGKEMVIPDTLSI